MICENQSFKNSMKIVDPKSYLTRFFFNSENLQRFSKPTSKIETNNFHEKHKTIQH